MMNFIADQQTLTDLNLLGKYKANSIFSLFNKVQTGGGERLLEQYFLHPLTKAKQINERSNGFQYFQQKDLTFPFDKEVFKQAEQYLSTYSSAGYLLTTLTIVWKKFQGDLVNDMQYKETYSGILATITVLNAFYDFLKLIADEEGPYAQKQQKISAILAHPGLQKLRKESNSLSLLKIAQYEHLLRNQLHKEMEYLLESVYELDVYLTVGRVANAKKLIYANALPPAGQQIRAIGLRHPRLEKAVGNSVSLSNMSNMLFLTGANMAGKSTLMKSFGIAVYMAHMGFPIAADQMDFTVMDGLYSSINVPDNLNMGLSHFYAEVLRVKQAAQQVSQGKNMVIIFDELFKGTNVKDAYDATLAVTSAFSAYSNCNFIISTHIIEVGHYLQKSHSNLQFAYLPTVMAGNVPRYTFKLTEGITNDRHGMMIIENEGILNILN